MREVVFVDFARTAFGTPGGSLKGFSNCQLGAICLQELVKKSGIWEKGGKNAVEAVFCGSNFRSKDSGAPVRYLTQLAGFPIGTEGHQVEMQDGSAITAINHAAFQIALGYTDVVMAGAMESASTRPVFMSTTTDPYMGLAPAWLEMRLSPDDAQNVNPYQVSDLMAAKWEISREAADAYALESFRRASAAKAAGTVGGEIIPVTIPATKKTPEIAITADDAADKTETLIGMTPFYEDGITTAGNAAGIGDGAGFVLMMSAEKAKELGYTPFARWVTGADVGVEPRYMGIGPVGSNLKALKQAGLNVSDMALWECNETSAAQNLAVLKELQAQSGASINSDIWNPNGGAIAFGHAGAASGARIAMAAMQQLEKTGGQYGCISACCGGGHGTTVIVENLRR